MFVANDSRVMRRSRFHKVMSGLLLVLLGALGTGLPTHGHGIDDGDVAELVAPDHHGHSVILTEQSDRLPTMPGTFAVATTT